jgi:hypothetical protein
LTLFNRTPGPSPFCSTKITPADSSLIIARVKLIGRNCPAGGFHPHARLASVGEFDASGFEGTLGYLQGGISSLRSISIKLTNSDTADPSLGGELKASGSPWP